MKKAGFQDWARNMNISGGSITLTAEMIAGANQPPSASAPAPMKDSYKVTEVSSATTEGMRASSQPQNSTSVVVETPPGWLGVSTRSTEDGALIVAVIPGGPAAQAGLQAGDTIQGLNGANVKGTDFEASITKVKPGTKVIISYMRSAWARETIVTVSKKPD